MSTTLPVADSAAVRRYARPARASAPPDARGGAGPALPGRPGRAGRAAAARATWWRRSRTAPPLAHVNTIALVLAGFLVVQTRADPLRPASSRQVLGEQVLAELREDFVDNTLALPVGVVESAGSGDLLTRTSRDVDQLGWSVRWALPEWTIAVVTAVLTFAAALSVGWWVALPCLLGVPPLVIGLRWYLARAKDGYLRESASYSLINATLTETVEGARTVEALGLEDEQVRRLDADIKESYDAERYTLYLRTVFFPSHGGVLPHPDGADAAVRRLALHPGARCRWATSPPPRSTCRC